MEELPFRYEVEKFPLLSGLCAPFFDLLGLLQGAKFDVVTDKRFCNGPAWEARQEQRYLGSCLLLIFIIIS